MVRGLDHLVTVVHDLEVAASAFAGFGFTVSPENRHAWGTANRLIQLDGFFLELLTVADAGQILEPVGTAFSFGAFNRDRLAQREGPSMMVLESADPAADRQAFEEAGLTVFDPFSFERIANRPDGTTAEVGFDLTFAADPLSPDIGYFTCRNRYPNNFWQAAQQSHANGAQQVMTLYMVAEDPSDHHEFLGGFTGQREMRATSLGLELETPRGRIGVMTPFAYRALLGDAAADALHGSLPQICAIEIGCAGLVERRIIPGNALFGMTLVLSPLG